MQQPSRAADDRSILDTLWMQLGTLSRPPCSPNDRPDGADPEPYVAEDEVPDTGGQHVKGEEFACGQRIGQKHVECRTVTVTIPKDKKVFSARRFARELFNTTWYADPYPAMGWCDWTAMNTSTLADGRTEISLTIKNWSHDRTRRFRLEVWVY
jgi:hypothetical protein